MQTPVWIAERQVVFVHPDGRRVPGQIAIGQPYTLGGDFPSGSYESHCPVDVGEFSPPGPVIGSGTLAALLNAVEYAGMMLHLFCSQGGRVLDAEESSELDLALWFGPLFRAVRRPDSER